MYERRSSQHTFRDTSKNTRKLGRIIVREAGIETVHPRHSAERVIHVAGFSSSGHDFRVVLVFDANEVREGLIEWAKDHCSPDSLTVNVSGQGPRPPDRHVSSLRETKNYQPVCSQNGQCSSHVR